MCLHVTCAQEVSTQGHMQTALTQSAVLTAGHTAAPCHTLDANGKKPLEVGTIHTQQQTYRTTEVQQKHKM